MKIKLFIHGLIGSFIALTVSPSLTRADEIPEKYEEVVRKGLAFLAAQQHKDGHWEGEAGTHPTAITALAGMAFLMDVLHYDGVYKSRDKEKAKHSPLIEKAVEWLIGQSERRQSGLIFSEHASEMDQYMYGHGLATQFLSWAFMPRGIYSKHNRKLAYEVLPRSVKYIAGSKTCRGGWYRTSRAEGHDFDEALATAIQVQALEIFEATGMRSELELVHNNLLPPVALLEELLRKHQAGAKVKPPVLPGRAVETAAALGCRLHYFGLNKVAREWIEFCQKELPAQRVQFGRDALAHFYLAQALFAASGRNPDGKEDWTAYRDVLFEQLMWKQEKDGSWPAADGIIAGRVCATALWCMVLQLDRNCHPFFMRR